MRLIFASQSLNNFRIEDVNLETIRNLCIAHGDTGCFKDNSRWREQNNDLSVTFDPVIYLNDQLNDADRQEALAHEQQHFRDFRRLARQLRNELRARVRRDRYSYNYMINRWAWFLYDICMATRAYHNSIGAMIVTCSRPSRSRPPR